MTTTRAIGAALATLLVCGCPGGGPARDADATVTPVSDADAARVDGDAGSLDADGDVGAVDGAAPLMVDVVVVGAGSGGVAAAIQAARLGASVLLVEQTDWIGGQMTAAAVATMDGANSEPARSGLYAEFRNLVLRYYGDAARFPPAGKSVSTCYWSASSTCFEPRVGRDLLQQMLAATSATLRLQTRVTALLKSGNTVRGVVLSDGSQVAAKVVVDATEHGDVIPLSGAAYRVGRSRSGSIDPAACIQDLTYVAVLKKYSGGVPAALKMTSPPPGYAAIAPVFATFVTSSGNALPPLVYPVDWPTHVAYRGAPDSSAPGSYTGVDGDKITRTGANWANDYPGHRVVAQKAQWLGTLPVAYIEDAAERRRIDCEAKLRTLNFIYYVQTALAQPQWSVADDAGYDTPYNRANLCPNIPAAFKAIERNMPVMPYVRESRRIVPLATLTAKQIKRSGSPPRPAARFSTAIAVGDYGTDLHNCRADADLEAALGETTADSSGGGPFQVPFEALIPETVDGLLAAEKNIGVSRLAAGAIRLQPITMATGQAVGVIAALAASGGVQPRQLRPIDVQSELVRAGAAIALETYSDVPSSSTLWPAVQIARAHQLLAAASANVFGAADAMTREQAALLLAPLFELDTSKPPATPTFQDVPPSRPSFAAVEAIAAAKLTAGCSASPPQFCPTAAVERAQMAVFLVKGLHLDINTAPTAPIFSDVPATHPLFAYVQLAASKGLFAGCATAPKRFCPTAALTRGQAATVAWRTLLVK